jgi:N-carbamoyl-L-amino-acid hydrolase
MEQNEIDFERLKQSIIKMGKIGRKTGDKGITRLALSQEDEKARDLLVHWLQEEGLEVLIDPIGNIFGIRAGIEDKLPIVAGSHLDTVKNSGIFDGALGVISALEVVRSLNDTNYKTKRPIVVACFTNEEGARFQPDMMGSSVFSGIYPLKEALLRRDDEGTTVKEALEMIDYRGKDTLVPGYYLELHVEQGPVLFRRGVNIGVVEGIQGIAWWHGRYHGEANHAGTTPLNMRKDALLGAAELCCELNNLAQEIGQGSVSTMGRLNPNPDVINVIPGSAHFTIDFRQYDNSLFKIGKQNVEDLVDRVAESHNLNYELERVADSNPVRFQSLIVDLVEKNAQKSDMPYIRMHSGAGHDAGPLSEICPSSMIFIPSIDGRSHCPEEKSNFQDIYKGCDLLLRCILSL